MAPNAFTARSWTFLTKRLSGRKHYAGGLPRAFFQSSKPPPRIEMSKRNAYSSILTRLQHTQRRSYHSSSHSHSNPYILPYTFLAICCGGYGFSYYAHYKEPHLLNLISKHAVCSLRNLRDGRYYTLLTSSFMHYEIVHLCLNMFGLYSLGPLIAASFGPGGFLALWMGSSLACDSAVLYWDWLGEQAQRARFARMKSQLVLFRARVGQIFETHSIGASGSVLGMFTAFVCMMPRAKIFLVPIPVQMPAWAGLGVFVVGSVYCVVSGVLPSIGHVGHLGGMAFGVAYFWTWGRRILRRAGR